MTEPLAFLHGRLLPQSEAHLALNDAGFLFGATVTDLCRTFRRRLYRWPDHLARFRQSCELTGIHPHVEEGEITRRAHELVQRNATLIDVNHDLVLVMFATPGPVGYYLGSDLIACDVPTFGMHTFPLPFARYRPWIEQGVRLRTPELRQIPAACIDPRIKHRSRMHWWAAGKTVGNEPRTQALLLDFEGNVTETASSNFLIVKNGALISPLLENVLHGVSLAAVAEFAEKLGIPLEHRPISLEECYTADEAILTCTTYCLAGVAQINDHAIPWPGAIFQKLLAAWSEDVGVEIHRQIVAGQ